MKNNDIAVVISGIALAAGAFALYKVKQITDKLDVSLDRILDQNDIEIKEEVVYAAVKQVVEEKSADVVKDITEEITDKFHEAIDEDVTHFIDTKKSQLSDKLEKALMDKIGEVDVDDIVKKVKDSLFKKILNNPNLSLQGSIKDVKDLLHDYYIWGRR